MKKSLAQLLIEYNQSKGYDISIESLQESLLECFPTKWQGDEETYRWRTEASCEKEIMDGNTPRYFKFNICTYSGENSWEDAGFYWQSFDGMEEVVPKEVRTIRYVSKEE